MNDTSLAEADAYLGKVLAGRYRVVRLLGSGGMGSVYHAEHVHMQKPVAVKILHRHMTTNREVVARFEREAVAAGRIEHPNVTAALDFGKLDDGSFYLALEYVEGKNLGDVLDLGALPVDRALWITRQIADALSAAHGAGIVHRDLKPDNVLLAPREGGSDLVKVLDFGIAKLHMEEGSGQRPLTQIGTIFGTPQYMSPEQGQGRTVDGRSDLYALGVMLFEMLAGKLPFDADDLIVLIMRHVTEPPPALPASIPEPVRALVAELLEKKPEMRIQSAALLIERIDAIRGGTPASVVGRGSAVRAFTPPTPTVSSPSAPAFATTGRARLVGFGQHALAFASRAQRTLVARVPALNRTVTIGGTVLPLVGVLVGGVSLALLGAVLTLLVMPSKSTKHTGRAGPESAASGSPRKIPEKSADEKHTALVERALAGNREALAALEALPQKQRRLEDARALGHGRCATREWTACVAAYKTGVLAFPQLQKDSLVLADVRRAVEEQSAYEDALRLAAHNLGERGLDLLWDAWLATKQEPTLAAVNRRIRQFLDDGAVREHAGRELAVVLELERAEKRKRCGEAKAVLPRALEYGDDRLLPILDRFKTTRGCGFVDLGDCWGCLRGNKELANVRDSASGRKGPSFTGG